MILPTIKQVRKSASFYPITGLYIGGVVVALVAANGALNLASSLIIFAFMALLALLFASHRELLKVHVLLDEQRTEMLARIDELAALLVTADVNVPFPGPGEQDARDDQRRQTNLKEAAR